MSKKGWLLLWLPLVGSIAASCGSEPDGPNRTPTGGAAGDDDGASAGEPSAGTSQGGSTSAGAPGHAGEAGTASSAGSAQAGVGGAGDQGGAAGAGGEGGALPLVAEATCNSNEDCLTVCAANGWPNAHCYGALERFCACDSSGDGRTCVKGTTEGCPTGTTCRVPHQCIPYGEATQGDPCEDGNECASGFTCVGFGNPLPNGSYTACCEICDPQAPPPGCDCTSGYCLGGFGGSPN